MLDLSSPVHRSKRLDPATVVDVGSLSCQHRPSQSQHQVVKNHTHMGTQDSDHIDHNQDQVDQAAQIKGLLGGYKTSCRSVVVDVTANLEFTDCVLSLLDKANLRLWPTTKVVVVGGKARVHEVLLHHSLRNTLDALYLALDDLVLRNLIFYSLPYRSFLRRNVTQQSSGRGGVSVYRRCMYCKGGEAGVRLLHQGNTTTDSLILYDRILQDQLKDLMGHKLTSLSMSFFPYTDFFRDVDVPGTTITLMDTLDARILYTLGSLLNFTSETREPPERAWGLPLENGSYNGMVGNLQREEADFSTSIAPGVGRFRAIDYYRAYPADKLTLTSLKPSLLPQYLAIVRPLTGELWVLLVVVVVVWCVGLWGFQALPRWDSTVTPLGLSSSFMYVWGSLLGTVPHVPTLNPSGRMLVWWWLVFCFVISSVFRSSLVAHLTVQGKTKTIETFRDLLQQKGWEWGIEGWMMTGMPLQYFSQHVDPVVKTIYSKLQFSSLDKALPKVLAGHYSHIAFRNFISVTIAAHYTDSYGQTPFYTSREGHVIMACFCWGFRKGAPFEDRFMEVFLRLEEAGIMEKWTSEVMARRVREQREAAGKELSYVQLISERDVVLGLEHLQGAFYLLGLGCGLALLTLLLEEYLPHSRSNTH
ncbi:probable glutamate receptor isoform X2 [Procambarus clarkii]|uniref:probable glutamate receptor isoform X2 n=1 Tax=Procambarus clarkii TaxID=6728 RepID=UPI003743C381